MSTTSSLAQRDLNNLEIPRNIHGEHILRAIEKIDIEGVPNGAQSSTYDLVHNDKRYPPKLVLSYANLFANGDLLNRKTFEGGEGTECFKLLREAGFTIEPKLVDFFSKFLLKFLDQAHLAKPDLKTKSYPAMYQGLQGRVSFGQGTPTPIPWIAFLREGQTVSNGIYPVFLYFREKNILILAYGISETNKPMADWKVTAERVAEVLEGQYSISAKRYGDSLVFATYKTDPQQPNYGLDKEQIINDLNALIAFYKNMDLNEHNEKNAVGGNTQFLLKDFIAHIRDAHLQYSEQLILRFVSSLCTKPFVILTGLAGSGKTKLAQAFATWIVEQEKHVCIVAVGADWTNREPLLGFANALDSSSYVRDDHGVVDLILEALNNPDKPYFLILDEMNLSHVERYFADFLSGMESQGYISLHSQTGAQKDGVPSCFKFPNNLFVIGTVNIDETTYMFSPKVLDRANVLEFRITEEEMVSFLQDPVKVDISKLQGRGSSYGSDFTQIARKPISSFLDDNETNLTLMSFFTELKKVGAEFGYRSAVEIYRLISILKSFENSISDDTAVDIAVVQKLLPKLHGSRRKLEPILITLAGICLFDGSQSKSVLADPTMFNLGDRAVVRFPLTLDKLVRMYKNSVQDGFTSFAEA